MKKILCVLAAIVLSGCQCKAQNIILHPGFYSDFPFFLLLKPNSEFVLDIEGPIFDNYRGKYEINGDTLKLIEGNRLCLKKMDSLSPANTDSIRIEIQLFGFDGNICVSESITAECKYEGVRRSVRVTGRTNLDGRTTISLPRIKFKPNVTINCSNLKMDISQFDQYQNHQLFLVKSPPQKGEFIFKIVSTSKDSMILESILPYNRVWTMHKTSDL